jgi:nuclear pore complex protein Nup155
VDDERNYFYTYTGNNSSLTIYSLGASGTNQLNHLGTISSLPHDVQHLLPPGPSARKFIARDKFGVASLHIIPKSESNAICLVAVTFHGLRIYFSERSSSMYAGGGSGRLRIVHLRFPPPATEQVDMGDVVASAYTNGSFVCAYGSDASTDSNPLVGASLDVGKLVKVHAGVGGPANPAVVQQPMGNIYHQYSVPRPPLAEFSNVINVAGRAWAVKQMIKTSSTQYGAGSASVWANASTHPTALNSLATQFTEPPDQFAVLSNVALTFVMRKRTSDVLRAVLEAEAVGGTINGPGHPGGLSGFVEAYVC